jgi:hypothetical protein
MAPVDVHFVGGRTVHGKVVKPVYGIDGFAEPFFVQPITMYTSGLVIVYTKQKPDY